MRNEIIQGSVLDAETWAAIPDQHVQCVMTSPPYWALRDYGVDGQLGLEATPEEYIERMVEVFRHVWRVLRDDGTVFLNMGDSYFGDSPVRNSSKEAFSKTWDKTQTASRGGKRRSAARQGNLKTKDLVGMPWRVALALQANGWYLRRDIIWHKPNPMPESASDRCTTSHEYLFHLTKKAKYFYDGEAIKEDAVGGTPGNKTHKGKTAYENGDERMRTKVGLTEIGPVTARNKRSVWTIPTCSYKHAHFATFPPRLVEPCILAGTSAKGCCPECGKPWVRVVESERIRTRPGHDSKAYDRTNGADVDDGLEKPWRDRVEIGNRDPGRHISVTKTTGWEPGCKCGEGAVNEDEQTPCIVFDPFMGSGTVAMVAKQLGRDYLGIELNPEYLPMIDRRVLNAQPPLFT